eukprot:GHRR01018221.1.p1 GENE.GHRR01018221.1~~GHRR01018221.1.p1  ORF type:complete len:142 (-),score=24.28 GHRR01018221.1:996-1421(-)
MHSLPHTHQCDATHWSSTMAWQILIGVAQQCIKCLAELLCKLISLCLQHSRAVSVSLACCYRCLCSQLKLITNTLTCAGMMAAAFSTEQVGCHTAVQLRAFGDTKRNSENCITTNYAALQLIVCLVPVAAIMTLTNLSLGL